MSAARMVAGIQITEEFSQTLCNAHIDFCAKAGEASQWLKY